MATLYDPLLMPKELREAHNRLDKAVDKLYDIPKESTEGELKRIELLFELYDKEVNTLV